EFRPAFDAWVATKPLTDPGAPPTPFAMPEYQLAATQDAQRLDAVSATFADRVPRDVQQSSNYVLGVVLFAVSLFFAGMSAKLRGSFAGTALLVMGFVVFAGAVAWVASQPISLSV